MKKCPASLLSSSSALYEVREQPRESGCFKARQNSGVRGARGPKFASASQDILGEVQLRDYAV